MTPEELAGIREVHARLAPSGPGGGWPEAYRQDVGALLAHVDQLTADLAARPPRKRAVTWRANYLGMMCLWSDAGASMGGYYASGSGWRVSMMRDYGERWFPSELAARGYIVAKLRARGWEV